MTIKIIKKMVILLQGNKSVYDSIIKETILSKVHDSFRNDFIKKRIKNSISSELFNWQINEKLIQFLFFKSNILMYNILIRLY
jgi:hypothetical protein